MDEKRLAYNTEEAARALGLSPRTVRTMIARDELRVVRVGRRVLIPAEALRELLAGAAAVAR